MWGGWKEPTSTARSSESQTLPRSPSHPRGLKGGSSYKKADVERTVWGKKAATQDPSLAGGQPETTSKDTRVIKHPLVLSPTSAPICLPGRLTKSQRAKRPEDVGLEVSPWACSREGKGGTYWLRPQSQRSPFSSPHYSQDFRGQGHTWMTHVGSRALEGTRLKNKEAKEIRNFLTVGNPPQGLHCKATPINKTVAVTHRWAV